jgi:hypothetical protein
VVHLPSPLFNKILNNNKRIIYEGGLSNACICNFLHLIPDSIGILHPTFGKSEITLSFSLSLSLHTHSRETLLVLVKIETTGMRR